MGGGTVEVSIAKTASGGYLMLSTSTPWAHEYIAGTVLIFLSDVSTITCTDKGIRDRVDGESKALYYLTADEMSTLSQTNISKIRFSIKDSMMKSSESLTGINGAPYSVSDELEYNTSEDVSSLYEE
jgi:hypothetical protein